jgi:hypothetical protein
MKQMRRRGKSHELTRPTVDLFLDDITLLIV